MDKKETIKYIVLAIAILAIGFFIGRFTIPTKTKTVVEIIEGETIVDTIRIFEPKHEIVPPDTLDILRECIKNGIYKEIWPERVVTEYVEITKDDTTAILKDYATLRKYSEVLFDNDTLGRFSIDFNVQYNRMKTLNYQFTPIYKKVTTIEQKTRVFSPYVGASVLIGMDGNDAIPLSGINGGFFINEKYGFQANYLRDFQNKINYYGGTLLFKF